MAWTKTIFVVDDDINPHDTAQVFAQAAAHCDPGRDIEQVWGPLDILDHAAPRLGAGMKVGFDCTRKIKGEEAGSQSIAAREAASDAALEALAAHVRTLEGVAGTGFAFGLRQWLLVQLAREHVGRGGEIIEALQAAVGLGEHVLPAFVILLGPDARIMDTDAALFHWMAHSDASRDWVRVKAGSRVTLVIDATPKMEGEVINGQPVRGWPPVLGMPGELVRQLDARWAAYGFSPAEQMRGG